MVFHNMKVALLVFPIHYSHGCLLQTYALYSKLKELPQFGIRNSA